MPRRGPTIADTVLNEIREHGPQPLDALARAVLEAGRTRAKDPQRAVMAAMESHPDLARDLDGRWCSLSQQLDGAIFTTRLTALERADEIVLVRDGLSLVERLTLRPRPFVSGGDVHLDFFGEFFELPWPSDVSTDELHEVIGDDLMADLVGLLRDLGLPPDADDEESVHDLLWETRDTRLLHGPLGWLPPLGGRQLLGIRLRDGSFETLALDRRDVSGPHVGIVGARIARLAHQVIGPDASGFGPPAIPLAELLELVATEEPELLRRPLPPISEVVTRGGLEVFDGLVGHPGTDWEGLGLMAHLEPEDAWGYEPPETIH